MKSYSWNVNGIRAAAKAGFFDWLKNCDGDVVMLQEVRALVEQMQPEWLTAFGYHSYWHPAQKKGYSGVGIYSKQKIPESMIIPRLGIEEFDNEGRFLGIVQDDVAYLSCYFPNSQEAGARIAYKIAYCNAVLKRAKELERDGIGVVIAGDLNIAHTPVDLANPKQNEKSPGYLPEERAWFTEFLSHGYVDTFRKFEQGAGHYTWWSNRPVGVRERNIGWRIDYHCVSESLSQRVEEAKILSQVFGSDHCPVSLSLRGK